MEQLELSLAKLYITFIFILFDELPNVYELVFLEEAKGPIISMEFFCCCFFSTITLLVLRNTLA